MGLGTYIQVGGITQSGGIVSKIWRSVLKRVVKLRPNVKSCLILGLGGGTAAGEIKKLWTGVKITGVDNDPKMVEMGRKYLGLKDVNEVVSDAKDFCLRAYKKGQKYDLILVDIYKGTSFPRQFEKDDFLLEVKGLLDNNGVTVFNRLYFGEKRPKAIRFAKKLEKTFPKVKYVYPEANIMFLCYN